MVELKLAHGLDIVMQATVGVPSAPKTFAVRMQESNDRRERIVVVYDIGEVGHGLVAFVGWSAQDGAGVVDGVYRVLPAGICQHFVSQPQADQSTPEDARQPNPYSPSPS